MNSWGRIKKTLKKSPVAMSALRKTMSFIRKIKANSVKLVISCQRAIVRRIFYKYQHTAFSIVFHEPLSKWGPNVVVCNDWQTLSLGALLKKHSKTKLIFDSHELETHRNPPLSKSRKRWMKNYEQKHLKSCDLITTVCEPIAEYLAQQYGVDKPLVITNAPYSEEVPIERIFGRWGRVPTKTSLREECGFSDRDMVLVIVGNATINRGIETVIEALGSLPEDIKLALLGKVTPQFKDQLMELISEFGIEERVRFVEPVHPVKVVDFLGSADVGVIPLIPATLSYDYALPNKFFECAFAGLPIVSSNTSEISRMMGLYDLGSTFAAGDPNELANLLADYRESWLRGELTKRNNEKFIAEFRFENSAQLLMKTVGALKVGNFE